MMSYLQFGLLVAGSTALGAYLCGPGLWYLIVWMSPPKSASAGASGLLMLLVLFGGTLLGGAAGFASGMRWIGRRGIEPWGLAGWAGTVLGLGLGMWLLLSGMLKRFDMIWFDTLTKVHQLGFVIFLGAAGGLVGAFCESWWRGWNVKRRRSIISAAIRDSSRPRK